MHRHPGRAAGPGGDIYGGERVEDDPSVTGPGWTRGRLYRVSDPDQRTAADGDLEECRAAHECDPFAVGGKARQGRRIRPGDSAGDHFGGAANVDAAHLTTRPTDTADRLSVGRDVERSDELQGIIEGDLEELWRRRSRSRPPCRGRKCAEPAAEGD